MSTYNDAINTHYGRDNLTDRIINALKAKGKDLDRLTREDLSTFDEFHIGGVAETRNLYNRIPHTRPGLHLLDIGSGLGGPARTLASEFGCQVTGLDLTREYVDAATRLTELVDLSSQITFEHGSALDMPFEADTFDIAWTQFVGMNIEDKARLYQQCHRVLKPGGYLAFHEITGGNTDDLILPVFWADEPGLSFLRSQADMQQLLSEAGFTQVAWIDLTDHSIAWFENMLVNRANQTGEPPLGFGLFVGDSAPQKAANIIQNIREGRITVVQAVFQATQ